ncbi:MAG: lysine--tRNA ligase [Planctomycetes bacterium]|nr:lysine--tRNA ligase [Planctomycetota bacterium]
MTDLAHPDRLQKIAALRAQGLDPYPARGVVATPIPVLLAGAGTPEAPGPLAGTRVTVAGRIELLRDFGKLVFAPLLGQGGRIQAGLERDRLGEWWPSRKLLDGGDQVGVTGVLGHTKKGEPTVWAESVTLLAKAVAPPPEKWHGLVDKELRYRRRYVDLWASEGVAQVFVKRSQALSTIRRYLEGEGYLEVETPTLHPIAGGAAARPFITHHNALDCDFYLRIAPELYLKRLVVGGLERVFEVSRNFRNEGLSQRHNPEFTMLELYEAQADYRRMLEIAEQIVERCALAVNGTTKVTFRGAEYDLGAPFPRVGYTELFRERNGFEFDDLARVRRRAQELELHLVDDPWKLMNDVFEATCEDGLAGPVFVVDYPIGISPLAKQKPGDPRLAERFELYVAGMELGNAFSELNDPAEQERRFVEQVASKDPEAPGEVDWDYVQALEYGMPPAGGLGIGVDRLVMVLTGQDSIRDVLLFPAMKPEPRAVRAAPKGTEPSGKAGPERP